MLVASVIESASPPPTNPEGKTDSNRTFRGLKPKQIILPEPSDIGVCRVDISNAPKELLPLVPASIVHSKDVTEGMPVGILGFPQGLSWPARFESADSFQMTPLLQTGVVSGVLPFSELPRPTSFVLDIVVNPGSSGSPLFLQNGDVVGVVHATRQRFAPLQAIDQDGNIESSENEGVFLPTSLGLAVPSACFPESWLSNKA
jgi:S1-C subfamily serine protease